MIWARYEGLRFWAISITFLSMGAMIKNNSSPRRLSRKTKNEQKV